MSVDLLRGWQFLQRELAPTEGRLAMAWRTAAICALVAMLFMVYGIPLAPIACYLVLFVMKPNTGESLLMGIGVVLLMGVMIPFLVWLAHISIDQIIVRMLVLIIGSWLFMYLSVASQVGPAGSILALVIGFIMTLISMAPFGEILTRGILYAALMAVVPMLVMVIFLALFGPSPALLAQRHLQRRCQAMAAVLREQLPVSDLLDGLREGNGEIDKMLRVSGLLVLLPKAHRLQLQALTLSSYQLMAALVALPTPIPPMLRERWAAALESLGAALGARRPLPPNASQDWAEGVPPELVQLAQQMHCLPQLPPDMQRESPLPKAKFFHEDVATNRSYAQFGVKVTFCALICYLTYTALQWQDIHTAMITCYVASLGSVAETVHKLLLRITGCLIGAAMGCAAIFWLMPHMTGIGELMALMFAGSLVAAWVAQGSERISYAGVQIGLAFALTVLQGFGPDVNISVALDRVYGILLGNLVVFLVFTKVWPVSASVQVLSRLQQYTQGLAGLRLAPDATAQIRAALPGLLPQLQNLRELAKMSVLEDWVLRRPDPAASPLEHRINDLETSYLQAGLGQDGALPKEES